MSKIPGLDETIRSFQYVGDVIANNPERAKSRWKNYTEDSVFGTVLNTGYALVGFSVAKLARNDSHAERFARKYVSSFEKFGAVSTSAICQTAGMGAQAMTFGIPNPVSGGLMRLGAGTAQVVNQCATSDEIDLDAYCKEGVIGMVRGGASLGGLIPFVGTVVENKLRGQNTELNPQKELVSCFLNIGTTVVSAGTLDLTSELVKAGEVGMKSSMAIAGSVGFVSGAASNLVTQIVNSETAKREIVNQGYCFAHTLILKNGIDVDVYTKKGEPNKYVPRVYIGEAIAQGFLNGLTQAIAARKKYQDIEREKMIRDKQNHNSNSQHRDDDNPNRGRDNPNCGRKSRNQNNHYNPNNNHCNPNNNHHNPNNNHHNPNNNHHNSNNNHHNSKATITTPTTTITTPTTTITTPTTTITTPEQTPT
uniref:Uncharacterized protein n=2 Tax=Clytia hemisphaerica TaxID=252671 RepID=A0A7M5X383_9CNID